MYELVLDTSLSNGDISGISEDDIAIEDDGIIVDEVATGMAIVKDI